MNRKNLYLLCVSLFVFLFTNSVFAQDSTKGDKKSIKHGQNFIDKDGDGYNDNAPDHDGDGIPNGLDPDWKKLKKEKQKKGKLRFVDLDGDGINDNLQSKEQDMNKNQIRKEGESSLENGSNKQRSRGQKKKTQ